jgi:hypothetical protein
MSKAEFAKWARNRARGENALTGSTDSIKSRFLAKLRLKPIPSSVGGYCGGRARLSPGMAIPLKAISIAFWGGGLIFEGLTEL